MTGTVSRTSGLRFMGSLLTCTLFVVGTLLLFELSVGRWFASSSIATEVIDIHSPSALIAKIRYTAGFAGKKVILLGDSLVAGQVMREHGDTAWRNHTLSAVLQEKFDAIGRDQTQVLNLGMNGLLPADLETLVDALLPMKPEAVVIDISLRSFSGDFATAEQMYSRDWLKPGLEFDSSGRLQSLPGRSALDAAIERALLNNWATYRNRELLRARYLRGEPRALARQLRDWIEGKAPDSANGPMAEMRLLLQVRSRYTSASLEPSNPQFVAFVRMLQKLADAKQKAVVFYATENPRLLPSLIEPPLYADFLEKLRQTVASEGGQFVTYLAPNQQLDDSLFLDHVHVDAVGNRIYGDELFKAVNGV